MGALLEAFNVSKSFDGVSALSGVSMRVNEGQLVLLVGPNGSGKTTLLNVLSGLLRPDSGRIFFKGIDITQMPPHERFRLGIARSFQIPRLFRSLSVLENLLIPLPIYTEENPLASLFKRKWLREEREALERALNILELLGLAPEWDKPAGSLSGGQMKLLELARVLMAQPLLVLLDEPLAGVNPSLARNVMERLRALARRGLSLLVVEHRLDIAAEFADYAYAMHRGRIIAEGPPQRVMEQPQVASIYLGR
mgnify:CR=1 FL=1